MQFDLQRAGKAIICEEGNRTVSFDTAWRGYWNNVALCGTLEEEKVTARLNRRKSRFANFSKTVLLLESPNGEQLFYGWIS